MNYKCIILKFIDITLYYFLILYYIIFYLTFILRLIYNLFKGKNGKLKLERSILLQVDNSRRKAWERDWWWRWQYHPMFIFLWSTFSLRLCWCRPPELPFLWFAQVMALVRAIAFASCQSLQYKFLFLAL